MKRNVKEIIKDLEHFRDTALSDIETTEDSVPDWERGFRQGIAEGLERAIERITRREKNRIPDFRCLTLHFYFRVKGADLFNGDDGFCTTTANEAVKGLDDLTPEKFVELAEGYRQLVANQLHVPLENVIQIDRDEYKLNTDEGDDVDCDEPVEYDGLFDDFWRH